MANSRALNGGDFNYITFQRPHANIDSLYGPYENIEEALLFTNIDEVRAVGFTVGIYKENHNEITEYWYKKSTNTPSGWELVEKAPDDTLSLTKPDPSFNINESTRIITLNYILKGKVGIKSAVVLRDGRQVSTVNDFEPGVSNEVQSVLVYAPSDIGKYTYEIRVYDIYNRVANVQYDIIWGDISIQSQQLYKISGMKKTVEGLCNLEITDFIVTVTDKSITKFFITLDKESNSNRTNSYQIGSAHNVTWSNEDSIIQNINDFNIVESSLSTWITSQAVTKNTTLCFKLYYIKGGNTLFKQIGKSFNILKSNEAYIELQYSEFGTIYENSILNIPVKIESGFPEESGNEKSFYVVPRVNNQELTIESGFQYYYIRGNQEDYSTIYINVPEYSAINNGVLNVDLYLLSTLPSVGSTLSSYVDKKSLELSIEQIIVGQYFTYNTENVIEFHWNHRYENGEITKGGTVQSNLEDNENSIEYYQQNTTSYIILDTGYPFNTDSLTADFYLKIIKSGLNKPLINIYKISSRVNNNVLNAQDLINSLQQNQLIAQIKEESISIIASGNEEGNISTPIYLDGNEKHIGIVFNRKEESKIKNRDVIYNAAYIDGKLIKNQHLPSSLGFGRYVIVINPEDASFELSSCNAYSFKSGEDFEYTYNDIDILYHNYTTNLLSLPQYQDLIRIKLININDFVGDAVGKFKNPNSKVKNKVPIGSISNGKMSNDSSEIHSLLEMTTATKKAFQKNTATFCYYKITKGSESSEGVVEVHTQGTSTLAYTVPNFKFTFYDIQEQSDQKLKLVQKSVNIVSDIPEDFLTAKADYMDSSHLNNTPTCAYLNNLIEQLDNKTIGGVNFKKSYARENTYYISEESEPNYLDAIQGEPCIIEYTDSAVLDSLNNIDINNIQFTNLGSFMLNIDKSARSLGLNIVKDNSYLSDLGVQNCYSMEGGSDIESSVFFLTPRQLDDLNTSSVGGESNYEGQYPNFPYLEDVITVGLGQTYESYGEFFEASTFNDFSEGAFETLFWDTLSVDELNDFKDYIFSDNGFEFRSEIKPEEWDDADLKDYLYPIARFWYFVTYCESGEDFKDLFSRYFDLGYAMLYYINIVALGQVDNLGKNSMFDSWDGEKFYLRPYDLDSQGGLDNTGKDSIKTYEEFYDTQTFNNNYFTTDLNVGNLQQNIENLNNKSFGSAKSELWKKFYESFKGIITNFYTALRDLTSVATQTHYYSADAIIQNAKQRVIDLIPINQYNIDFRVKYLIGDDTKKCQEMAFGDRWDKFRDWITKRFIFADSYLQYYDNVNIVSGGQEVVFKTNTAQYFKFVRDDNSTGQQLALSYAKDSYMSEVQVVGYMIYDAITEIEGVNKLKTFGVNSPYFKNLLKIDLSDSSTSLGLVCNTECPYLYDINISNTNTSNFIIDTGNKYSSDNVVGRRLDMPNLQKLQAKNLSNFTLCIVGQKNIRELDLRNSTISNLILEDLSTLKSINLSGATVQKMTLSNLRNLETLDLGGCTFSGGVIEINSVGLNSENFNIDFSNIEFNGSSLTFTGQSNIKSLNLVNSKGLEELNIGTLSGNLVSLDCSGNSSIKQITVGTNTFNKLTTFKCSPGIEYIVAGSSEKGSYYAVQTLNLAYFDHLTNVSFKNCSKFRRLLNLNTTTSGTELFYNCHNLIEINNSNITLTSGVATFAHCYNLKDFPDTTIQIKSSLTNVRVSYMFMKAHKFPTNKILDILHSNHKIIDYSAVFAYKVFFQDYYSNGNVNSSTEGKMDLDSIFQGNTADSIVASYMFVNVGGITVGNYITSGVTGSITEEETSIITGSSVGNSYGQYCNLSQVTGKFPSSTTQTRYCFYNCQNLISISSDIFSEASNIQDISCTFSSCSNLVLNLDTDNLYSSFLGNKAQLTQIAGLFGGCNELTYTLNSNHNSIFKNCPSLQNLGGVFSNCGKVGGDATEFIDWSSTAAHSLISIENLFQNTNVTLTGNLIKSSVNSSWSNKKLLIGGIFAKDLIENQTNQSININFIEQLSFPADGDSDCSGHLIGSGTINRIRPLSAYTIAYRGGSGDLIHKGIFEGCKNLTGSYNSTFINKLKGHDCRRMFRDSNISELMPTYNASNASSAILTVYCTRSDQMFYGVDFTANNFKKIHFELPNDIPSTTVYSCNGDNYTNSNSYLTELYSTRGAFANTKGLNLTEITFDDKFGDIAYTFAGSQLTYNVSNLKLPKNVVTAIYMFANNFHSYMINMKTTYDSVNYHKNTLEKLLNKYSNNNYKTKVIEDVQSYSPTNSITNASITGTVQLQANSSSDNLEKLRYVDHMFEGTTIDTIKGNLFSKCLNIISCRFMFSNCNLSTIDSSSSGIVFSGDNYESLVDVSGMFSKTVLEGSINISLNQARNVKYADFMFEDIYSKNTNALQLSQIFTTNNSNVLSTIGFGFHTNFAYDNDNDSGNNIIQVYFPLRWIISQQLIYADFMFARAFKINDPNDQIYLNMFGDITKTSSTLSSVYGMFAQYNTITADSGHSIESIQSLIGNKTKKGLIFYNWTGYTNEDTTTPDPNHYNYNYGNLMSVSDLEITQVSGEI